MTGGVLLEASRRCAIRRQLLMAFHSLISASPGDPIALVESCYRAVEWILASHAAKGLLIPRPWIDHPYGEEEITRLEEEVLPVIASFLARIDEIDQALEAEQEALIEALQASSSQLC
ncbi:hypothetical protein RS9917_13433 [Synechococcus sp. RS9917]|nr:hypothetical protein RS9917_13433 [Synechococcus sp. RS9917]